MTNISMGRLAIDQRYKGYQYGIEATAEIATDFYALEKAAKISYRVIDLAEIFKEKIEQPLLILSSQIKDLVLVIESTRFFCVSFPLFFQDEKGRYYIQNKTKLQSAEKISLTTHLGLKTLFGADRLGLIRLGILGTYSIGHLSIFKWLLESTIFMYNFFGTWDGAKSLIDAQNDLQISPIDACLKIGASFSKLVLIAFALTIAALNISTIPCKITILSLGIISDAIGLTRFFYQKYSKEGIIC